MKRDGHNRLMKKVADMLDVLKDWMACRDIYAAVMIAIEFEEEGWNSNFKRFDHMISKAPVAPKYPSTHEMIGYHEDVIHYWGLVQLHHGLYASVI